MTELIEEFINVWNDNCNMISIQQNDFNKFINVINKFKKKSCLDIQEKKIFIELIEMIADTIYIVDNCVDKYETTYYQQTKIYDEPELQCCSNLLNKLESEIAWDLENEYDKAFSKVFFNKFEL